MSDTANYRGATATADIWRRAYKLTIHNQHLVQPRVEISEEEVVSTPVGDLRRPTEVLGWAFDPALQIAIINPQDLSPTGQFIAAGDVYVFLFSLYMKLAADRDAAESPE